MPSASLWSWAYCSWCSSVAAAGLLRGADGVTRCAWCGDDPLYVRYHDTEWGLPVHNDRRLFEKLSLEGFQAGLSWITILRKRENFRHAFAKFDAAKVARFGARDIARLLQDVGIVRHRGKIEAVIGNAQRYLDLRESGTTLDALVWQFAPRTASRPKKMTHGNIPTENAESRALSKELKRRGWRFVGPTTMYAFSQAMGLVNDHLHGCARR